MLTRTMNSRVRLLSLVLPLLAGTVDAAGTIDVVSSAGRCATDCTGGVILLPFAPTITPLHVVGIGSDRALSVTAAVVAYAAVLAVLVAWWWFLGGLLARQARTTDRAPRRPFLVGLYTGAVLLTFLVKLPILAAFAWSLWLAVPVELAIWSVVLWTLTSQAKRLLQPS